MTRSTPFILSMALGSALVGSPMVWADGGTSCSGTRGHMMSRHGEHGHSSATGHLLRHLLKNKQEIGLTDEQIAKLRAMALDADRERICAEADKMVSERELRSLLWDEKAELPAIEAKVKETESLEATVRIIGIRAKRELVGVLTPEQKTKLKALWEQHRQQDRSHLMRAETDESGNDSAGMEAGAESADVLIGEVEGAFSAG
ncbi:MAG TPA: Spy/CpxP family protein refolding chaperone [Nitrospira sp.]|nr:Spy/CpxP family protein refolding chaperone [Nitrospira sp.]